MTTRISTTVTVYPQISPQQPPAVLPASTAA
jgi:hypothetical protein